MSCIYLPNFHYFKSKSNGKVVKKACLCDHYQQLNFYVYLKNEIYNRATSFKKCLQEGFWINI